MGYVPLGPVEQLIEEIRNNLDAVRAQTDKLTFDAAGNLNVNVQATVNPPNLDVALSTRASESTLSGIKSQTDKLTFDANNYLRINLSADDVGVAKEDTLSGIKAQTDKLTFDANNNLNVNVQATVNPPNLDVALSSRASESTLSAFSDKFPSAAALGDSMSNPTTTVVGSALLAFDGTNWLRVRAVGGRLEVDKVHLFQFDPENRLIVRAEPHRAEVKASATSDGTATSYTVELDVSKVGRKLVVLKNGFDQDATVDVEASPDGTDWITLRSGISVPAGEVRWSVLDRAVKSLRVKVTTAAAPSSGTVFEVKVFGLQ